MNESLRYLDVTFGSREMEFNLVTLTKGEGGNSDEQYSKSCVGAARTEGKCTELPKN